MNTPVSFEIAKLLKEKGFPQLNQGLYYTKDKEHCLVGWGFNDRTKDSLAQYSAPTISEVVMWLYEKYNIWISVDPENDTDTWFHTITHNKSETVFGNYSSLTEAYEKGIEYILNNMI